MTTAWRPPKYLPVWVEVPETPPPHRVTVHKDMSPLRFGLSVIRSGGFRALCGSLLFTVFAIADMLLPLTLGAAIDRGIAPLVAGRSVEDSIGPFLLWIAAIIGLYAVINVTYRFGGRLGWYCVQRANYDLSTLTMQRMVDPRGMAGPMPLPGRLLSVATLDVERTSSVLYFAIYPPGQLVGIGVAAVSLFWIHPILGWVVVIGAPLLLVGMTVIARPLHSRSLQEQEAVADAAGMAGDLMTGYRVLTGIHARRAASDLYRSVSGRALRGTVAAGTAEAGLIGINAALSGLFAGGVAVVAAILAFNGSISVGSLIAAAGLAQLMLTPLRQLVETAGSIGASALASARRLLDHLNTPYRAFGDREVDPNATLTIQLAEPDVDISVEPGQFVAVDLPAAAADATIAALIGGTDTSALIGGTDASALLGGTEGSSGDDPTPPVTADIRLGGYPLAEFDPVGVRGAMLVAPHEADLLEPTVTDNVSRNPDGDAGRADTESALHVAACETLANELPRGYDTSVADSGHTLSGGQRQRVALARAVARRAPLLVLHNPTNAVDSVTEQLIAQRLQEARLGSTTLVITGAGAFHAVADRSFRPSDVDAP